jgi:hypothetical protein
MDQQSKYIEFLLIIVQFCGTSLYSLSLFEYVPSSAITKIPFVHRIVSPDGGIAEIYIESINSDFL